MKRLTITICAALVFASCNEPAEPKVASASTTETKATEPAMPDSATAMKRWADYMTPGDMHKMMASWNGEWTGNAKHWSHPGATPVEGTMETTNKTTLNGLYQESYHKGVMMGMPFEGKGITAYDNVKKVFLLSWIDNFGSGIMNMEGKWSEENKTLTSVGKGMDPVTETECEIREVFKIVDNDTHHMEMYTKGADGNEFKTMEIIFKRKK